MSQVGNFEAISESISSVQIFDSLTQNSIPVEYFPKRLDSIRIPIQSNLLFQLFSVHDDWSSGKFRLSNIERQSTIDFEASLALNLMSTPPKGVFFTSNFTDDENPMNSTYVPASPYNSFVISVNVARYSKGNFHPQYLGDVTSQIYLRSGALAIDELKSNTIKTQLNPLISSMLTINVTKISQNSSQAMFGFKPFYDLSTDSYLVPISVTCLKNSLNFLRDFYQTDLGNDQILSQQSIKARVDFETSIQSASFSLGVVSAISSNSSFSGSLGFSLASNIPFVSFEKFRKTVANR